MPPTPTRRFVQSTRSWHIATEVRDDGYALTECHRQVKAIKVATDISGVERTRKSWARCSECPWLEVCSCFLDGAGHVIRDRCSAHG